MTARAERHGDELIARRHLRAGAARVWAAFTTPTGLAAFWGGSHAEVPPGSVTVDARPGGEFALDTRAPDGATRRLRFVYVRLDPPRELVFDEPVTGLRTTVTLRPAGEGTELTVHQRRPRRSCGPPGPRTGSPRSSTRSPPTFPPKEPTVPQISQRDLVDEYFAGFRASDHPRILATLTDDVEWVIHGHRTTRGRAEFDGEIENPAFAGSPRLDVERVHEDGPVVVVTGEGRGVSVAHGPFRFAFNDLFTFRDGLIARVDSYVVPLP